MTKASFFALSLLAFLPNPIKAEVVILGQPLDSLGAYSVSTAGTSVSYAQLAGLPTQLNFRTGASPTGYVLEQIYIYGAGNANANPNYTGQFILSGTYFELWTRPSSEQSFQNAFSDGTNFGAEWVSRSAGWGRYICTPYGVKLDADTDYMLKLNGISSANWLTNMKVSFGQTGSTLGWSIQQDSQSGIPLIELKGYTPVPEPSSLSLLALGGVLVVLGRRKRA